MRRLTLAEFATVALLTLLASLGFQRVFAGNGLVVPLIGAVLIPSAIAAIGMYRQSSVTSTMLWSILGFVVYSTYAALGDTAPNVVPTLDTLRELARGLTSGWADLLTITLPAPQEPRLTIVPLALTWFAAAMATEFAHRSRSSAAPVLPPLAVYLATQAFAASQPKGTVALPVAIAGTVLAILLLHANRWAVLEPAGLRTRSPEDDEHDLPQRSRVLSVDTSAYRWIALGVPVIALALLIAALVAVRVPEREGRFDPRSLRTQQVDIAQAGNPLDGLKAELALNPEEPPLRFTVQTDSLADAQLVGRVRLVVLDRFDGSSWSSSDQYTRAGAVLPPGPDILVASEEVDQRITIDALPNGPWLPAADRPVRVQGVDGAELDLAVDPETGVIVTGRDDRTNLSYVVTSEVARPSDEDLERLASEAPEVDTSALTNVPDMPADLRRIGIGLIGDAGSPYDKLKALESALSQGYAYSEDVPSGSSYGRLDQFLTRDGGGYAEQFAGAFATIARSLGFPTRLAYGYLTAETDPSTGDLQIMTDITSRQAHVWPEVLVAGSLWVPFEPTPVREATPLNRPARPPTTPEEAGGIIPVGPSASNTPGPSASSEEQDDDAPFRLSTPVMALLVLIISLIMLLGTLVVLKRLRRRRRRRGRSTTQQVLGAWAEVTDRLLEVGVALDRSMTAKEVVAASTPRVSGHAVERLSTMVPLVTFAIYSPVPPANDAVSEMWLHADAFHREVLEGTKWYRGTVALLNPRPLILGVSRR